MASGRPPGHRAVVACGALAVALLIAACTGASDDAPAARSPSPTPFRAASPTVPPLTSGASTPPADDTPTTRVILRAQDNVYDRGRLRVPVGQQVTLTLENRGAALHDWRVLGTTDSGGAPIQTALLKAGEAATIQFTINQSGNYPFYCEVHPVEMRGSLIVE